MVMIYPTKDCKYDVGVWCSNFHEIEAELANRVTKPAVAEVGQVIRVKAVDENGVPTEFESVDPSSLPEVTSDDNGKHLEVVDGAWKVVEQNAGDAVKREKVFDVKDALFHQTSLGLFGYGTDVNTAPFQYVEGDTYIVAWEDVEYECVAQTNDVGGVSYTGIGNLSVVGMGSNTGEPFLSMYVSEYDQLMIYSSDTENTTRDIVIYHLVSGEGSGLPEVTEADNGKHLEVVDGEWALVGDVDRIVCIEEQTIPFTFNEADSVSRFSVPVSLYDVVAGEEYVVDWDGVEYTCVALETTVGEVKAVFLGNGSIVGFGENTGEPFLAGFAPSAFEAFTNVDTADNTHTVGLYQDKSKSTELPEVTEADNGKVLGVVDGKWGVVEQSQSGGSGSSSDEWVVINTDDTGTAITNPYEVTTPTFQIRTNGKIAVVKINWVMLTQQSLVDGNYLKIVIDNTNPYFEVLHSALSNDNYMGLLMSYTVFSSNGYRFSTSYRYNETSATFYVTAKETTTLTGTNYVGALTVNYTA